MTRCRCKACLDCELATLRALSARPKRGGLRRRFERVEAFAAPYAARAGLPIEEVVELLGSGRTPAELALLYPVTAEDAPACATYAAELAPSQVPSPSTPTRKHIAPSRRVGTRRVRKVNRRGR